MCAIDLNAKDVKLNAIFPIDVALHIAVITGCCAYILHPILIL
jgi:hypothetical protein